MRAPFLNRLATAYAIMRGQPSTITNRAHSTPFGTGGNGITTNAAFSLKELHQMRPYERREAQKTSRWLDNNLGIAGALNDNSVSYAIGNGIDSYASTGDSDYDQSADYVLKSIFDEVTFDIAEEQCMAELQCVAARGMLVDGDDGAAKILLRDKNGNIARKSDGTLATPQVQLFTSDQIDGGDSSREFSRWEHGTLRNLYGKALKYRVQKEGGKHWDYNARDFALVLDRKRIGQGRGIPWCHRAQRSGNSMLNLGALEEARAHVNALFAAIITTPTGETPEALEAFIMDAFGSGTNEKADGSQEKKAVLHKYVELMGGGKVPVFPQGTKLEAYASQTPSTVFTGHMDYLVTQLALSYGIPPAFVWAIARGTGPETRMTLAQASWYFNRILMIIVRRFVKPMRDWVLQYGLLTGKINGGRMPRNGVDYRTCTWHGPRDITIDERYYHKTWLDRLADGKGTEEEYYSLQGLNADTQALKRIKEIAKRKKWCEENGVEYHGEFVRSAPGTILGKDGQPVNEPDDDDEDEDRPTKKRAAQAA